MTRPAAEFIANALRCSNSRCACHKRPSNGWYNCHCPTSKHKRGDTNISFGVKDNAAGIQVKCFSGCSRQEIIEALKERGLWSAKPISNHRSLSLSELANAKKLPIDFLKSLGVSDDTLHRSPCVRIPYPGIDGSTPAVRFRHSLHKEQGRRFTWRKGDHVMLYGLDQLAKIKERGWTLVVEGESDTWTARYHNIPCLGLPGKGTWKSEWARLLEGVQVCLWQERDATELPGRMAKDIPDLRFFPAPEGIKDLSDAHCQGKDIVALVEQMKAEATVWKLETRSEETSPRQSATLDLVLARFRTYLFLPDSGPVEVVLGAIAANLLPGDPVWLILVGPSGWGKTEILNSVVKVKHVHPVSVLTESSLLSGTPNRQRENAKGGLLREMGEFGILWVKDFGSILSMNRDSRGPILAALREIYDGSWTRHVGTDGGRTLTWTGKAGLVGGATPSIDQHYAVMAALGERFAYYRLPESDEQERAQQALRHAGHEQQMRAELANLTADLIASLQVPSEQTVLSTPETNRLIALATFATRCRSAVERDAFQGREIQLVPGVESPTRLVKVLKQLLVGLKLIGVSAERVWQLVTKVALDSMPALRQRVLLSLLQDSNLPVTTTPELAKRLGYPSGTIRRTLEDLACYAIVERETQGEGKADHWTLSAWTKDMYRKATTLPEIRGDLSCTSPHNDLSSTTINISTQISGKVPPPHDGPVTGDGGFASVVDYPEHPCAACGCGSYWLREVTRWSPAEWVCSRCHPNPEGGESQ